LSPRRLLRTSTICLVFAAGCDSCQRDRPAVPFSASPHASASASVPVVTATSSFTPVEASAAPSASAVYELGGHEVRARSGRVFRAGLTFDADGDEVEDLLALTEATDGRKAELAFFRGGDQAVGETKLVALPKELDLDRCARSARLARIAPTVAVLEIEARCEKEQKEQWLAVVRLDAARSKTSPRPPELRLELRARAPLVLALGTDDKDKDGHVDLIASAKLREGPADLTAPMVFLDRPAGFALDPSEPESGFKALAKKLVALAATADVRDRATAAMSLARAVCSDLGEATLETSSGSAKCGESGLLADALLASGLSHARAGDTGRAALVWEALASIPNGTGRRTSLEAALDKLARPVDAVITRRVAARPSTKKGVLAPFAWTADDELTVAGDGGVVEVDAAAGSESPSDAIAWPRTVAWRTGDTSIEILGAARSCDPLERRALASAREAKTSAPLPSALDLLPRGAGKTACKPAPLPLTALAVDGDGATVAVGPEVFRLAFGDRGLTATPVSSALGGTALSPPGAARSADGKTAVLTLAEGLLVTTGAGFERWRGPELTQLGPCAPNPKATRVACLTGGAGQESVVIVGKK
jgi:hypothetical protein